VDRAKDLISRGGYKVSAVEIESLLLSQPKVAAAALVGIPDDRLGEAIALVVRGSGPDDALRNHLRRELPNFMQPAHIVWRDELPRSPNGKLDREVIKSELIQ
jgi:acyl-coenzyme A synthetase/AMP-(fatty) acid ligase